MIDGAYLPSEETTYVNDIDGRMYVVARFIEGASIDYHIVAMQTDALPPRGPYCVTQGCNRHRNGWAHDYGTP